MQTITPAAVLSAANVYPGRRYRRNCGIFGDSKASFSWSGGGQNQLAKAFGLTSHIAAFSGLRAYFPRELNFGVAGETTNQWMRRLKQAVDAPCDIMYVIGSSNDRRNGTPLSDSKNNALLITDALTRAGKVVIWFAETPKGSGIYQLTEAQQKDHIEFHRWALKELPKRGAIVIDAYAEMVDPASALEYPLPDMMMDGAHQGARGAFIMGRAGAVPLWTLFPEAYNYFGYGATYNLDRNIAGSLTPNPLMAGMTGTVAASTVGVGPNPQIATGWQLANTDGTQPTGLAIEAYKQVDAEGEWQYFRIAGRLTAPGGGYVLQANVAPTDAILVGDTFQAAAIYEAWGQGIRSVELAFTAVTTDATPKTTYFALSDGDPNGAPGPLSSWPTEGRIFRRSAETPPFTRQATPVFNGATLKMVIHIDDAKDANFVIRVKAMGTYKTGWAAP